eukprot:Gb_31474 [translate_table: standard]
MGTVELISPSSSSVHQKFTNHGYIPMPLSIHFHFPKQLTYHTAATTVKGQPALKTKRKSQENIESPWKESGNYSSLLQGCTNIKELKHLHAHMLRAGLHQQIFLATKLVSIYVRYSSMENARLVFDKINKKDVVLWNAMIRGYAINGLYEDALALYYQMQRAGFKPDNFTFPFVLKACAGLSALKEAKEIHGHIIRIGFELDIYVRNSLVAVYIKCGSLDIARQLFDRIPIRNVVTWSAIIDGYVQSGHSNEALVLFRKMQLEDVIPNSITIASVLQACAHLAALRRGKQIHGYILRSEVESDVCLETALVDMYARCGKTEIASQVFAKMSQRDVVAWNSMIGGYAQSGHANEAFTHFHKMQLADLIPDSFTVVHVLRACTLIAALQQGKWIHGYTIRRGLDSNVLVGNSLIHMYAKCGSIVIAHHVFDKMRKRDVISWSAMIAGYGMHGHGYEALALFTQMQEAGVKPDYITFICLLSACSHSGLLDEGWQYFDSMIRDYCIIPGVEHYACMVDLLGRSGHLQEALDFIKKMPLEPDVSVWGALLGACRIHNNVELGECVAEHLFELDPEDGGGYVLLSNIYAAGGRWDDVKKVRTLMKDRQLKKTPGCSFIEVNNKIHAFFVGDRSHPQSEKIYAMLETLSAKMEEAGYVPNTNFVLHEVEEEIKEHMLCSHSEKLAIAFGLISTIPGTPIRITKNLRVCGDCHSATKIISNIASREIIMRDANRFHHFKDGLCSCGDYW